MLTKKSFMSFSLIAMLCIVLLSFSIFAFAEGFVGLYDFKFDKSKLNDWTLKNGILHDFEEDKSLMQNMQVENYEGKIEYNQDKAFVSSGASSMKCIITNDAMTKKQVVKLNFDTGKTGKDVTNVSKISFDVFTSSLQTLSIKPIITSLFASYYFDEQLLTTGKNTVVINTTTQLRDYLANMVGFSLTDVLSYQYRIIIPLGTNGSTTVYMDNLCYTYDSGYAPPALPKPMVRASDEINNFNDENAIKFVTPEYEVGIAGYDNQNQYLSTAFSSDIKYEGSGALKFTMQGLNLDGIDLSKSPSLATPMLSFKRIEQIGKSNLNEYKTLSVWMYYDAVSATGGKSKNPDTIKYVFEHRNNYYPSSPNIVSDIIIPKHKWVNLKINLSDSIFALKDYTSALRFWTYGFNSTENDRSVYFDNVTLSKDAISTQELNGKKYSLIVA